MENSQSLKIALVGCGGIAQAHWRGIQAHATQLVVSAVVDTNPDRAAAMAKQTGGQPFASLESALADGDFAAVDIMLPHNQHEAAAVAAFAAGKHVVLEKPMSTNLASCARILAAAQQAGTVFLVAEQAQYWPDARQVQALIQAGAIGEIITARAYFGNPAPATAPTPKPWRYELAQAGGGITIDGGAHWLRPLRMWLGEVAEVSAVTGRPLAEMEGESFMRALLRFESGVVALFDTLYGGAVLGPGEEFRVTGTAGEIISERGYPGRLLLFDKEHPEGKVLKANLWDGDGRLAAFGYELADFAQAVLAGTPLAAAPEYALGELRTALAIYRSAVSKQWERVWD
ncbi:MAG TPA: Gfo/Idh/MocA family oxidoreductase [Caldilineaceae bacterium]|nr:Gfo/Idh/MocA family oxidoreductase [Caldilineaceae bacterium]